MGLTCRPLLLASILFALLIVTWLTRREARTLSARSMFLWSKNMKRGKPSTHLRTAS